MNLDYGVVAVYYRVSSDMQDFSMQKHAVEEWLHTNKHQKILYFEDFAISGGTSDRPAYQKMIKAAYQKKIDTIVVYRLDRLSRQASPAMQLVLKLDELGVDIVFLTQPELSSINNPVRHIVLAVYSYFSEMERLTICERVRAGLKAAKAKGKILGAPQRFDEEEKRKICLLRKNGYTLRDIAREMKCATGTVHRIINEKEKAG